MVVRHEVLVINTVVRYHLTCQVFDEVLIPVVPWTTTVESLPTGAVVAALAALNVRVVPEPNVTFPAKTTFPLVNVTVLPTLSVGQLMNQLPPAKSAGIELHD